MTLGSFQASQGVPIENQIILLDNKKVFDGYRPVIHPYFKSSGFSRIVNKTRSRFGLNDSSGIVNLPFSGTRLFLGYFDKSIDNPTNFLRSLFQLILQKPHCNFVLLMGKGDYQLDEHVFESMPDNLQAIYANNVNTRHPKARYLPMGRDFRNLGLLRNSYPQREKKELCYCNFSLNTHPVRREIYEGLKSKQFIEFDHMGDFLAYSLSRQEFLRKLSRAKFCVCPRGNAIDTFRLWDCLYVGTIPIVVREAVFHEYLTDLPVLFLDHHSEYKNLSVDYLESAYEKFLQTSFNYSKLDIKYWLRATGESGC